MLNKDTVKKAKVFKLPRCSNCETNICSPGGRNKTVIKHCFEFKRSQILLPSDWTNRTFKFKQESQTSCRDEIIINVYKRPPSDCGPQRKDRNISGVKCTFITSHNRRKTEKIRHVSLWIHVFDLF